VHCRSIWAKGCFLCTGWRPTDERVLNLDHSAIDQLWVYFFRTVCQPLSFVYPADLRQKQPKIRHEAPAAFVFFCTRGVWAISDGRHTHADSYVTLSEWVGECECECECVDEWVGGKTHSQHTHSCSMPHIINNLGTCSMTWPLLRALTFCVPLLGNKTV